MGVPGRGVERGDRGGRKTLNIPDTVGYTVPYEYGNLIRYLREHVKGIDKTVISVHCHNDLGMAVANSLAAVRAARGKSSAPSTASASGPATVAWKKWSWPSRRARTFLTSIPTS